MLEKTENRLNKILNLCKLEKVKRERIYKLLLEALQGLRYAQTCMPTDYYKAELEKRYNAITTALREEK